MNKNCYNIVQNLSINQGICSVVVHRMTTVNIVQKFFQHSLIQNNNHWDAASWLVQLFLMIAASYASQNTIKETGSYCNI